MKLLNTYIHLWMQLFVFTWALLNIIYIYITIVNTKIETIKFHIARVKPKMHPNLGSSKCWSLTIALRQIKSRKDSAIFTTNLENSCSNIDGNCYLGPLASSTIKPVIVINNSERVNCKKYSILRQFPYLRITFLHFLVIDFCRCVHTWNVEMNFIVTILVIFLVGFF